MEHKILLIEKDNDLLNRMESLLLPLGYQVWMESRALEGLNLMEKEVDFPFSLVVASYQMAEIRGDELLERARKIAPGTRRMILTDLVSFEPVVNAVNNAELHACLSIFFEDKDFVTLVSYCCRQYEKFLKLENLKKITARQNKQMFQMAQNFKQNKQQVALRIKKRKEKIRILQARLIAQIKKNQGKKIFLKDLLEYLDLKPGADQYTALFKELEANIVTIINRGVRDQEMVLPPLEEFSPTQQNELISKEFEQVSIFLSLVFRETVLARVPHLLLDGHGKEKPEFLELLISQDKLEAHLKVVKFDRDLVTIDAVKEYLELHGVCFGIKDDQIISAWIALDSAKGASLLIARGKASKPSIDAQVQYYFETDYLHAGKVQEDGSIDFKDRGDVPFVVKETLLAEKQPMEEGYSGMTVTGEIIPMPPAQDIFFDAGSGALLSEDGCSIIADIDGQPHLDAKGNVSVLPEMHINGDIDYTTGNVSFDGNIIVAGTVLAGFKVKGVSLTVEQIQGGEIDLTGDLNVGHGITDAHLIYVQGSVQAKYVNNSIIKAFGNLIVQKEIIDSEICLSGACINKGGVLISSKVAAKMGVEAGRVGTEKSSPSRLRVGVGDHIQELMMPINKNLKAERNKIRVQEQKIADLDTENYKLQIQISEAAHIQDRSQIECRDLENKMEQFKYANKNQAKIRFLTDQINKMQEQITTAEQEVETAFAAQDHIAKNISQRRNTIKESEDNIQLLLQDKKALEDYDALYDPVACVTVAKSIMPGTIVTGLHSRITIRDLISRMQVKEIWKDQDEKSVKPYWTMDISKL